MKRILIVDDEYLVRLGLKTIIDWESFGYTVDGEAANGKEALDFFEKNPADLILTDIKMPVMDGLELTRRVKERNKKTQIVILSHYDDFSYAQEAVELGAFRYILKSELTKTNLENTLKSLYLSSDETETANRKTGWKEEWESFIEKYLLPSFLRQIKSEKKEEPKHTRARLPDAPSPFSAALYCAAFSVSCRTTLLPGDAREKFPRTISILFEDAFGNLAGKGRYYDDDFHFAAIAPVTLPPFEPPPPAGSPEKNENEFIERFITEKIRGPCIQIVKNVRQYYDVNLFIGASSFGTVNDCERLLNEAHRARTGCLFSNRQLVGIRGKTAGGTAGKALKKNGPVSYAKLIELIDTDQKEGMLKYIQNIFNWLRAEEDYAAVYDAFIDFLSVGKLIHEKHQLEEEASLSENKFKHGVFFDLPFIDDVEQYIHELYLSLLSTKQNGKANYSYIVKKCIDFIRSDYQKNIGLSEAAEIAGVSHSYLSFIFKQETGVNFSAALTRYRIEKAKKLLASTGQRIYQVAEQVGFSNPYYFSKVFKEISGYSCKEFRDRGGE